MSDLQLALIALGIALVAAVIAYNKWQESRFQRRAEAGLQPSQSDVLLRSTAEVEPRPVNRVEPVLGADEAPGEAPPEVSSRAPDEAVPAHFKPGELSEAIDFIVGFQAPEGIAGRTFIEAVLEPYGALPRAVHVEGRGQAGWEQLDRDNTYPRIRAGLQVVDRRGAVTSGELEAFAGASEKVAADLGLLVEVDGREEALATAHRLDKVCEQVDIQIVFHVISREGMLPGTRIRALAEAAGLGLEADGRFRLRDEQGLEVFSAKNEEATAFSLEGMKSLSSAAVSLELDIPRASGGPAALARFRRFAEQFAAGSNGVLVDDNRAPLSSAGLDAIAQQLKPVYEVMERAGVPAGSSLALRLFS